MKSYASLYFQFIDFYFIFNIIFLCNYFLYIGFYIDIKKLKTNINDYLLKSKLCRYKNIKY